MIESQSDHITPGTVMEKLGNYLKNNNLKRLIIHSYQRGLTYCTVIEPDGMDYRQVTLHGKKRIQFFSKTSTVQINSEIPSNHTLPFLTVFKQVIDDVLNQKASIFQEKN